MPDLPERRDFLLQGMGAALACSGCQLRDPLAHIAGGFNGVDDTRGHLLQTARGWPMPAVTRHTQVLIAGGGVAGLAAARALRLQGIDDFAMLELEDEAGGNSRGGVVGGLACPVGAHYLPLPGDDAPEVQDLLEELRLRQRQAGRWGYDERHLCHSPQERLFFNGSWQDGLLPVNGVGPATLAQYRQFATLVAQLQRQAHWIIPSQKVPLAPIQIELTAITFDNYLKQNGFTDPCLRWYLDYCCRDDYGAGLAVVSAWAGIHYFASRHGFSVPGVDTAERDSLLTWPEGNAWLTRQLAAPLAGRLHSGCVVLRMACTKHGVEVDALNLKTQNVERWMARRGIVALPIFVAARVVESPPDWLLQAARQAVYAPWLVANVHIRAALHDRPGAAPSWDSVIYGDAQTNPGLGYVDASHQRLQSVPGATVLTYYRALGDMPGSPGGPALAQGVAGRRWLLSQPWTYWRDAVLSELAQPHPDLMAKVTRIEITRYGHAMVIPVPGNLRQIGLQPLSENRSVLSKAYKPVRRHERLTFAHSDWAGYSIFEEAFTLGHFAA